MKPGKNRSLVRTFQDFFILSSYNILQQQKQKRGRDHDEPRARPVVDLSSISLSTLPSGDRGRIRSMHTGFDLGQNAAKPPQAQVCHNGASKFTTRSLVVSFQRSVELPSLPSIASNKRPMAYANINRAHQQWPGPVEPPLARIGREAIIFIILIYLLIFIVRCES
jgi:hypothetical protein